MASRLPPLVPEPVWSCLALWEKVKEKRKVNQYCRKRGGKGQKEDDKSWWLCYVLTSPSSCNLWGAEIFHLCLGGGRGEQLYLLRSRGDHNFAKCRKFRFFFTSMTFVDFEMSSQFLCFVSPPIYTWTSEATQSTTHTIYFITTEDSNISIIYGTNVAVKWQVSTA